MDCNESRGLIEADTDGEIELVHHLELAAHLRSCPACTRRAEAETRVGRRRRAPLSPRGAPLARSYRNQSWSLK